MSELGHLRTNRATILRVRTWGYNGRKSGVAVKSESSQKRTLASVRFFQLGSFQSRIERRQRDLQADPLGLRA